MELLKKYQILFNKYLEEHPFNGVPEELYEPANYIMKLGGKRLRPAMVLMAYELFKDDLEKALPIAMSVEVFHNFSLVHDDIMDEALVRRGKPTVHEKYSSNTAILSGDVMLVLANQVLFEIQETASILPLIRVFNRTAIEVCEGQQMDMNFETRQNVTIPEYIKMISLKTAALLAACLEMGAIASETDAQNIKNIYNFGLNIGIAFQLQDDILDTFGDPKIFGKKIGGDIIQNKKTFLILKALEVANSDQKNRLSNLMNTPTKDENKKIQEVTELLRQLNIPDLAEQEKEKFKEKAFASLAKINIPESRKLPLTQLAEIIIGRKV